MYMIKFSVFKARNQTSKSCQRYQINYVFKLTVELRNSKIKLCKNFFEFACHILSCMPLATFYKDDAWWSFAASCLNVKNSSNYVNRVLTDPCRTGCGHVNVLCLYKKHYKTCLSKPRIGWEKRWLELRMKASLFYSVIGKLYLHNEFHPSAA